MKGMLRQVSVPSMQTGKLIDLWKNHPALRFAGQFFAGFLTAFTVAGGRIAGAFMPFSVCLVAAIPLGVSGLGAALGACLGYLQFWGIDIALEPICVTLLMLAALGIFHNTTLQDQPWFMGTVCAAMTALIGMIFLFDEKVTFLRVSLLLCRSLLGFGATVTYRAALQRREGAVMFLIACALSGMASIQLGSVCNVGIIAAVALGLFTALLKNGLTFAAVCGVAVDLSGRCPVPLSALLCLAVVCVRFFHQRLPILRPIAIGVGGVASLLFLIVLPDSNLLSLSLGTALGLSLPQQLQSKKKTVEPDGVAIMQQKLYRISQVLDDMQKTAQNAEEPQTGITPEMIYDHAAEKICRCCANFPVCWEDAADETYYALSHAAPAVLARGKATAGDFPEKFAARCRHLEGFTAAVNQELDGLFYRRQYRLRTAEQRRLLSTQLGCLSRFLRDTAEEAEWHFPTVPRYRMEIGSATAGRLGATVCGDQWACFMTEPNVCYVLLSDGMGTGEEAEHESKVAINLLADLLRSGCEPSDALQMLNGLYILRGNGVFSAVDVLQVDLGSGSAFLYKWGGATTYLKQGHTVKKIGTAAPPPGVGVGVGNEPERIVLPLQKGQMLILTTDGVSAEETTSRISGFDGTNLKELAAYVIAGAQMARTDDMSAIALCLYPRHNRGSSSV